MFEERQKSGKSSSCEQRSQMFNVCSRSSIWRSRPSAINNNNNGSSSPGTHFLSLRLCSESSAGIQQWKGPKEWIATLATPSEWSEFQFKGENSDISIQILDFKSWLGSDWSIFFMLDLIFSGVFVRIGGNDKGGRDWGQLKIWIQNPKLPTDIPSPSSSPPPPPPAPVFLLH